MLEYYPNRFTEVVLYLPEVVHHGLSDSNPYVRKTAVMGVVKLFHVDPTVVDGRLLAFISSAQVVDVVNILYIFYL